MGKRDLGLSEFLLHVNICDSLSDELHSFQGCCKSQVPPKPTFHGCQCIYFFFWGRFLNHSSIAVRIQSLRSFVVFVCPGSKHYVTSQQDPHLYVS